MVDFERIKDLSQGEVEFEIKIITLFLDSSKQYMVDIARQIKKSDLSALDKTLHALKGACRSIGADSFAEKAITFENIIIQNSDTGIKECMLELEKEHIEAIDVFEDYLKANKGSS